MAESCSLPLIFVFAGAGIEHQKNQMSWSRITLPWPRDYDIEIQSNNQVALGATSKETMIQCQIQTSSAT